ncbi:MAG: hypothetical protein ACE5G2_07860 [Candidatus Krumholzibacteriia bacterium]
MSDFEKLVVEASGELTRGLVVGWCTAKGLSPEKIGRRILWPDDWDIRVGSTLEGIVEALRPGDVTFLLVRDDTVDELVAAMQVWETLCDLRLRSRHRVLGAYFDFKYEIFSRDEAAEVRSIFESVPDGVNLSDDYAPEERSDLGAAGTEMYAPAHAYVCRAEGTVGGRLRGVLTVRERARQHERIQIRDVRLRLGTAGKGGG